MKASSIIKIIAIYSILFLSLLGYTILTSSATANEKAIIKMAFSLIIIWVFICGSIMYMLRDSISSKIKSIQLNWKLKFFLFTLFLILFEELITTSITNLAPLFGGEIGKAYITASTNYFHVILFHSAIMFIPFILVWTYLISKYDFSPNQIFLLFGLLGTIGESFLSPYALISGFWFFVYGLMIYLPAYSLPKRENLKKPTIKAYIIAIIVPILISIPVSILIVFLRKMLEIKMFV